MTLLSINKTNGKEKQNALGLPKRFSIDSMNEILIIGSLIIMYGAVLVAYRLFGKTGLYAMSVIATIFANIEVLMLVDAFGMEQTLGNVIFAATYLITDILSENEGKKAASKAVSLGIFTSVMMLIITQYWFLYTPSANDWAAAPVKEIFTTTPRLMLASLLGYIVSQHFDVWLYHKWWSFTEKRFGNRESFLWLRNNGSTLISQIVNAVLFNTVAFWGMYDTRTFASIIISSYVIYIFTSLADTPFVYLSRKIKKRK